uniref:Uncharacterized protein n=1 Tax=Arundo donax TaxID=35708 RepID=A0A0A8YYB9_ARUDO
MVMLAIYDQFIVPFLCRRTGYANGITHLQCIGIGFASMILASVIAAVVSQPPRRQPGFEPGAGTERPLC